MYIMADSVDIHRLGRTARAGAEGHGVVILGDFESFFLRSLSSQKLPSDRATVEEALLAVPPEAKAQAYQAWLGYYNSHTKSLKWSSAELVKAANEYADSGLRYGSRPPGLEAKTVGKMGLRGVPGLNVIKGQPGGGLQGKRARDGDAVGHPSSDARGEVAAGRGLREPGNGGGAGGGRGRGGGALGGGGGRGRRR